MDIYINNRPLRLDYYKIIWKLTHSREKIAHETLTKYRFGTQFKCVYKRPTNYFNVVHL